MTDKIISKAVCLLRKYSLSEVNQVQIQFHEFAFSGGEPVHLAQLLIELEICFNCSCLSDQGNSKQVKEEGYKGHPEVTLLAVSKGIMITKLLIPN
jgi:hypothetical protein